MTTRPDPETMVDIAEFRRRTSNVAASLLEGSYDRAQFKLLMLLFARFEKREPLGVQSTKVEELRERSEMRKEYLHLARQIDMYGRILNRHMTVRQFAQTHLDTSQAVMKRFLTGLFSNRQMRDLLRMSEDEILGIATASQEFATDTETLGRMEEQLGNAFGFFFGMRSEEIDFLCEDRMTECAESMKISEVLVPGIGNPPEQGP